jgi:hypothetical protein
MTDTFWTPEPDDTDPVAELWRMDNEARADAHARGVSTMAVGAIPQRQQ